MNPESRAFELEELTQVGSVATPGWLLVWPGATPACSPEPCQPVARTHLLCT